MFEDKFYVDESDYDELRQYVIESNAKNETVYLFRYYQSIYDSQEAREFEFVKDWAISRGTFGNYSELDTNAYIAQMWVQLDFDIIDLTFTKDNVVTIIPVVMSPMDIAADADHPVYTTDDSKGLSWWQILLAILLVILIMILLLKFAPGVIVVVGKILLFVITLPFKLLGALFKPIHSKVKASRERRKQERVERKEQRRIEREQSKQQERERRQAEKQKRRDERHDRKRRKQAERDYEEYVKYEEFPWSDEKPKRLLRKEQRREKRRKARGAKGRRQQDKDFARWRKKQERQTRKKLKKKDKKKLTLADLDNMSDAELAELYYEEYGIDEGLYTPFDDDDYPI